MNSLKPLHWAGIILGSSLALYFVYFHLQYFGDVPFLGGILLLEIIIASVWDYKRRFFVLLILTFLCAGMHVPLQSAGTIGRWVVLAAGALVGSIVWMRAARRPFRAIHLIAFFCICAAFVSARVSTFIQMASLKALSLGLLFVYCSAGARLAVLDREERFFRGLVLGSEVITYFSAVCYFVAGNSIWGNPNSLGAVMSIAVFPILLWGWITSDAPGAQIRRLGALLLCTYLIHFSMSRAAMVAVALVTAVFCLCLHRYKLLIKVTAGVLFLVAVGGMLAPESLNKQAADLKDAFLYKGHKEEGVMGSRRGPWDQSVASIKDHPWFGTGYGTSPTGMDPGLSFGRISSSAETEREHGSSYITIAEWVGLLGVLPFLALVAVTLSKVWKVCALMNQTTDPRYYSIPLAMVVLSGFVHATFEDWLFAAGSYLSVFFWVCAFQLDDVLPDAKAVPALGSARRDARPLPTDYGAFASNR
jgi:O-antigen ligase